MDGGRMRKGLEPQSSFLWETPNHDPPLVEYPSHGPIPVEIGRGRYLPRLVILAYWPFSDFGQANEIHSTTSQVHV